MDPEVARRTLQGLGAVAQTPLARGVVRYWWVTLPIGYMAWAKWKELEKKQEASALNIITAMAPVLGLAAALITMNQFLADTEARTAKAAAPKPAIKDAEFTPLTEKA